MTTVYNEIAGRSLERLTALSDGVFAFAMTLLILDVKVPSIEAVHGERELWLALLALAPRFAMYLTSFVTLGIFWIGQHAQVQFFARGSRDLAWIHIAFLAAVAVMPFSTALMAEFITFRVAVAVYWLNIAALGWLLYASWAYAERMGLVKEEVSADVRAAVKRRIVVGQGLYALGALLCLVSTYASIAFILALQLNYAVAPRLRLLYKL